MVLLFLSFLAGVLTVLAPCTLPLLPIILGGSWSGKPDRSKPLIITASLAVSLVLFTLLLKVSTLFIDIPQNVWSFISGGIIFLIGLINLFPDLWTKVSTRFQMSKKSDENLNAAAAKKSYWGDILIGASLGPVFSSCSPTYFLILATILPQSFATGFICLIVYSFGLSIMLLFIAYLGQKFVRRLRFAADPKGWFKRGIGIVFIFVGLFILTGLSQKLQLYVAGKNLLDGTRLEGNILQKFQH